MLQKCRPIELKGNRVSHTGSNNAANSNRRDGRVEYGASFYSESQWSGIRGEEESNSSIWRRISAGTRVGQDAGRGTAGIVTRGEPNWIVETICGCLGEAWMFKSGIEMDERGDSNIITGEAQELWWPKKLCEAGSFKVCKQGSIKIVYGQSSGAGSISRFRGWICISIGCGSQAAHKQISSGGGYYGPGSGTQCIYGQDGLQVGACRRFVETDWKGLVGPDIRPEGRLPSLVSSERGQKMVEIQMGWSAFAIQGHAVWPTALAPIFLQNNARVCKNITPRVCGEELRPLSVQIPGCTTWCGSGLVCGRFCSCSGNKRTFTANSRRDFGAAVKGIGTYKSIRQGSVGASADFRLSGFPAQHIDWTSYDSRRKIGEVFKSLGHDSFKRQNYAKGTRIGGGEDCFAAKSFCSGFNIYERIFQIDFEAYGWQQRVVVAPTFVRDGKGGFTLAPQKSAGKKRTHNVEAGAGGGPLVGRSKNQQQGLGRNIVLRRSSQAGTGSMEERSTGDGHSHFGDVGNTARNSVFSHAAQGPKRSNSDRQYDLQEYDSGRVSGDRYFKVGEEDSRRGLQFGRDNNRRQLDSVRAQRGSGLAIEISGRERLAVERAQVERSITQVAKTERGSFRIWSGGRQTSKIQYAMGKPVRAGGASQRNGSRVDGNVFLRSTPISNDRPSFAVDQRAKSTRSDYSAGMAADGVVTPATSYAGRLDRIRLGTRSLSAGSIGKVRSIQKPKVAVSSSSSKRVKIPDVNEDRQGLVKLYSKRGFEATTLVQYESHKKQYERYTSTLHLEPWPAKIRQLEEYMAWLIHSGRPGSIKGAWTSIMYFQSMQGRNKLQKSVTIKKLERAAEKALAEKGHKPRDAFLSDMARDYCLKTDKNPSRERVMGAAILVVGMRGLLRAGEIMNLKFRHIQSRSDRFVQIDLVKRKNRVRGAAKIFIEASGNVTCPVRRLNDWLKVRGQEASCNPDDLVFTTHMQKGTQLSYAIIKALVVEAATGAGYVDLNLSGHSLRIGGATEALIGGMTELQIRVMGDWKSDAYMRYLRGVEPAAAGATRLMGL